MEYINIILFVTLPGLVICCTESFVKAQDGAVVVGRSLEFDIDVISNITAYPKHTTRKSTVPSFCSKSDAIEWDNLYDVICVDALNTAMCGDGFNKEGLTCSALLLPGYTKYDGTSSKDCKNIMANYHFCDYLLGKYRTTDAVRKVLKAGELPKIYSQRISSLPNVDFELHFSVIDATGDAIVVEYTADGRIVHENTARVLTNSPTYDFHLLNLNNYVQLTKYSKPASNLGKLTLKPFGLESGLLRIPGDYTPTSRFVRTAAILHSSDELKTADEAVNFEFHMMNFVDIPKGAVQVNTGPPDGVSDYTQWIIVKDLKNLIYYVRSYDDLSIRKFDLKKIRPGVVGSIRVERKLNGYIPDVTNDLYK